MPIVTRVPVRFFRDASLPGRGSIASFHRENTCQPRCLAFPQSRLPRFPGSTRPLLPVIAHAHRRGRLARVRAHAERLRPRHGGARTVPPGPAPRLAGRSCGRPAGEALHPAGGLLPADSRCPHASGHLDHSECARGVDFPRGRPYRGRAGVPGRGEPVPCSLSRLTGGFPEGRCLELQRIPGRHYCRAGRRRPAVRLRAGLRVRCFRRDATPAPSS